MAKTRGGKREGAGRPAGTVNPSTITKEQARDALRTIVLQQMSKLIAAQLDNATGIRHFIVRGAGGKFERLTDPEQIEAALNADGAEEGKTFWIYTKDPSVQAFTDLMNRALDKPKEQEQDVNVNAEVVIKWQDE
jgi:hypothetical protein